MSNSQANGRLVPRFSIVDRDRQQQNGIFIPNSAIYVKSGSLDSIAGSTTGSVEFQFDTFGLRLKRVEVFHSGSSETFDISLENKTANTGSNFDPRAVIAEYNDVAGSTNFCKGIDQIEDLIALTDTGGKLYLNIKPEGGGSNWFKYLLFFEAVVIYTDRFGQF